MFKKFIHTKLGAKIAYKMGLKGFNRVGATIIRANGKVEHLGFAYNSRVDKGGDLIASLITGAAQNSITSPLPPKYIALQDTGALTPAHGDTTISHECAQTGLTRALGSQGGYVTPTVLDGAASYTVTKTFTNTSAGSVTIYGAALFDASSTGNLFVEANLSANAILAVNDTLALTWTVSL